MAIAKEQLVLTGTVSVRGGTPGPATWGGGGGGRIKLFAPGGRVTGKIDASGGDKGEGSWERFHGFPERDGSIHISF